MSIRVFVRLPDSKTDVLEVKRKGSDSKWLIDECTRKLGMHVPMMVCEGDGTDTDADKVEVFYDVPDVVHLLPTFPKGTAVRACNLKNTPELNGLTGTVVVIKDGKAGIKFNNGSKGMISTENLVAVDTKSERAAEALKEIMSMEPGPAVEQVEEQEPIVTLTREEQKLAILQVRGEFPKMSISAVGQTLVAFNWNVEKVLLMFGEQKKQDPEDEETSQTAAGATDDVSFRKNAKDDTIGITNESATEVIYSCRKCRLQLCSMADIMPHEQSEGKKEFRKNGNNRLSFQPCGSVFVEEGSVEWISAAADEQHGDLKCPKCTMKVGTYKWSGQQCSCGHWVSPAFVLQQSKMDRFAK